VPRLVAVGVRGPRLVLVERHGRHDHRRGGGRWQRVGFRHLARPPPRAWGFAEVGGPRARAAWERWFGIICLVLGGGRVLIGKERKKRWGPVETLLWLVRVIITCFLLFWFFV
jgi:hypothetical protein